MLPTPDYRLIALPVKQSSRDSRPPFRGGTYPDRRHGMARSVRAELDQRTKETGTETGGNRDTQPIGRKQGHPANPEEHRGGNRDTQPIRKNIRPALVLVTPETSATAYPNRSKGRLIRGWRRPPMGIKAGCRWLLLFPRVCFPCFPSGGNGQAMGPGIGGEV